MILNKLRLGLDFDGVIVDMDVGFPLVDSILYDATVNNYKVTIITARRKWGDESKRWGFCLEKVMKYYNLSFNKVVYCNTVKEKIKYINSCNNIDIYVEDRTEVTNKLKIPVILFGEKNDLKPNVLKNYKWVKNWRELCEVLTKENPTIMELISHEQNNRKTSRPTK